MIDHETANAYFHRDRRQANNTDEMVWSFSRGWSSDNGVLEGQRETSTEGIQLDVGPKGLPWDSYNPRYFWNNDRENTTELTFRR